MNTAEVLRHVAANFDAGREAGVGLECRRTSDGAFITASGLQSVLCLLLSGYEFRLAPKTITYTVTHPEPLREAPADETTVVLLGSDGILVEFNWRGSSNPNHVRILVRGNLFATKEDAQAADAARLAAYGSATS